MSHRILYIEDEVLLARIVLDSLRYHDYHVDHFPHGQQIESYLASKTPDLCILDVMLPHTDGFSLGKIIRKKLPHLPIIFLTAKTETKDVVQGFQSGGTDYLKKPFSIDELLVRIENQLQLIVKRTPVLESIIEMEEITMHPERQEIIIGKQVKKLSHREAQLAALILSRFGEIIHRKDILLELWGDDSYFNSRNLDVYIRRFREILELTPYYELITLKGVGYRMVKKSNTLHK